MIRVLLIISLLAVVALASYEILALINKKPGDTISEVFWWVSPRYPILVFLIGLVIGVLAGHFWWQRAH